MTREDLKDIIKECITEIREDNRVIGESNSEYLNEGVLDFLKGKKIKIKDNKSFSLSKIFDKSKSKPKKEVNRDLLYNFHNTCKVRIQEALENEGIDYFKICIYENEYFPPDNPYAGMLYSKRLILVFVPKVAKDSKGNRINTKDKVYSEPFKKVKEFLTPNKIKEIIKEDGVDIYTDPVIIHSDGYDADFLFIYYKSE